VHGTVIVTAADATAPPISTIINETNAPSATTIE
jgi:hypothetical protein